MNQQQYLRNLLHYKLIADILLVFQQWVSIFKFSSNMVKHRTAICKNIGVAHGTWKWLIRLLLYGCVRDQIKWNMEIVRQPQVWCGEDKFFYCFNISLNQLYCQFLNQFFNFQVEVYKNLSFHLNQAIKILFTTYHVLNTLRYCIFLIQCYFQSFSLVYRNVS